MEHNLRINPPKRSGSQLNLCEIHLQENSGNDGSRPTLYNLYYKDSSSLVPMEERRGWRGRRGYCIYSRNWLELLNEIMETGLGGMS